VTTENPEDGLVTLQQPVDVQIIYLNEEDDVTSAVDRLDWAEASRIALVLPERGDVLTEWLDLVRLRRHADELRLELGLVTADSRVRSQAKDLGMPVFTTVRAAQASRRGWWRGRWGREWSGRPKGLDVDDRREIYRRMTPRPGWQRWLLRYAAILLFFITLAIVFVAVSYAVPGATIVLKPEVEPLEVTKLIVADPQLDSVSFSGASVPGRLLIVTEEWQAQVETTGNLEVPDAPARGTVVLVNQLAQPVNVPAGTRVATSAGDRVVFQVIESVEVPGVVGGTAEADIVAVEPGPSGNVAANLINRIEGALSLQLQVRNLEPTEGGGVRLARAVTEADWERLRAQVLQQLQALAVAEMEAALTPSEFLARDSLRVVEVYHETYSHFPGEQTERLALEIRAELHGTAVDETQAVGLVYEDLAAAVRPGYELVPDSLAFHSGEVLGVDSQGRVSFELIGEGMIAAQLALEQPIEAVAGQETDVALSYLYEQLPLREFPTARVWPDWFGRLPYLPVRIQTEVETSS
jgi:hypothetical protein